MFKTTLQEPLECEVDDDDDDVESVMIGEEAGVEAVLPGPSLAGRLLAPVGTLTPRVVELETSLLVSSSPHWSIFIITAASATKMHF